MEYSIGEELFNATIGSYHNPKNSAISITTAYGEPECKLSTNPAHKLPENVIAIRDDETFSYRHRDALVEAGVITPYKPLRVKPFLDTVGILNYAPSDDEFIKIHMGWTKATLYEIIQR